MAQAIRAFSKYEEVIAKIGAKARIVTAMAVSEPRDFMSRLHLLAHNREFLNVYCANPSAAFPCFTDTTLAGKLEMTTMFLTGQVAKKCQGHRVVHYFPHNLSAWARNIFYAGPVDVFWGTCTPPTANGYVSLGPSSCYEPEVIQRAKLVVLEVNPQLPFVFGAPVIHVDRIDHMIETDHPNPVISAEEPSAQAKEIAQYVADLIEDDSTLQFGIGSIPNALADALMYKKNLGIHTEMINDSMMKLMQAGIVNGNSKRFIQHRMVGSFALGTPKLYSFLNNNPGVEFLPSSLVNGREALRKNYKMTSVNTAVEIDLTGQVCSESVGHAELSGVGGAADTHVGAQWSEGGRGILAIPSRAKNGESKLVAELKPGAKVSISRNDVDTIVTEFGVAHLRGKSVGARVEALIAIAHPDVREKLRADAIKFNYL